MGNLKKISKKKYVRIVSFLVIGFVLFTSLTLAGTKGHRNSGGNPAGIIPGTGGAAANGIVAPRGISKNLGGGFSVHSGGAPVNIKPAGGPKAGPSPSAGASFAGKGHGAYKANSGKGGFSGNHFYSSGPGSNVAIKMNTKFSGFNKGLGKGNKGLLGAGDSFSMAIEGLEELTWIAGAKGPNPGKGNAHVKAVKDGDPGNPGGGNGNGHWGEGNHGNGKGNVASGNQGRGVGEGMTGGGHYCDNDTDNDLDLDLDMDLDCDIDLDLDIDCDMDLDYDNDSDSDIDVTVANTFEPVIRIPKIQGCPATMEAASNEIGIPEQTIQIRMSNTITYGANIQPCEACQQIVNLAAILRDPDGSKLAALTEIINSLAPTNMPFTPEMGTQIAAAFESNLQEDSRYAAAAEYIDAFVEYAHTLENELPGVVEDPMAFVLEKYGSEMIESDNPNVAAFVAMRLEALEG